MVRAFASLFYFLWLSLISCNTHYKEVAGDHNKEYKLSNDSLLNVIKYNSAKYNTYSSKDQTDSGLIFLQKTQQLKPYCTGEDSLGAYYKSAMLNYAYELNFKGNYMQAENILQELLNTPGQLWVNGLHNADAAAILGNIYTRYGDYKKALLWLQMSEKKYKEANDTVYYVKAVNNEAIALQELQLYDSALNLLQQALQWNTPDNVSRFINLFLSASCCLELKRSNQAISFINRMKEDISSSTDNEDKKYNAASLNEVEAALCILNGQYRSTINLLHTNFDYYSGEDSLYTKTRDAGKLLIKLGTYYLHINETELANYYFHKALYAVVAIDTGNIFSLPSKQQLYAENTIMEALDGKAEVLQLLYAQKKDVKYLITAVQCYELSFEVEQKLMQYFSYDESKLVMLNESRLRSQSAIHLCYQLYQLTNNTQWAEKAFEFAEKNKAFVLLESVKRNLASNSALQNDTLYQKAQSLQLQLAYNERSIAEAETDADKKILLEQKGKLENELLFAKTALSRQSNAYRSIMEKEDSISATQVSSGLLNEQTGLIEFFSADTVTYAFVLSKKATVQFLKYPATLSEEIDSLLTFYSSSTAITNNPQAYEKAAFRLYCILGFQQFTKDWQNMIIIPDGKLCLLPFDALITEPATTLNLQQAAYFINQCNTVYGYSAKILIEQKRNITDPDDDITVFAPVFANRENNQDPLQYSYAEATSIGENNNARLFLKDKATLDNFKNQFASAGILHVATHAYADTGISNNSKIEFIDSSLLLTELYAMHTNASLVVLSACETGIGQLNKSEGSMSLARGFYYTGAKNVITSYWNVDDKSTASLFASFYKEINSNSYTDALHDAKKKYIKNATATSASPYYWAGFVHIGLPQKNKKSNNWYWWLLALPLIAAIYYRNKKRGSGIRNN